MTALNKIDGLNVNKELRNDITEFKKAIERLKRDDTEPHAILAEFGVHSTATTSDIVVEWAYEFQRFLKCASDAIVSNRKLNKMIKKK